MSVGTKRSGKRALALMVLRAAPALFIAASVGIVWTLTGEVALALSAATVSAGVLTALRRPPSGESGP